MADVALPAVRTGMPVDDFVTLFDAGALSLGTSASFSVAPLPRAVNHDPRSAEYAAQVIDDWRRITGREVYDAMVDEAFDLDEDQFLAVPYPFSSGDPVETGRYFGAIAWLLRVLGPDLPQRITEMGSGWGHLALSLAQLGREVTAVDLNPASVALLRRRAQALGVPLRVVRSTFLDHDERDAEMIVFFESFHHCAEPLRLLDRCRDMLTPDGVLVFLAEAVYDVFHAPWGVRLDGSATFMSRHAGWLELGFERSFFYRELNARGFALDLQYENDLGPYGQLDIARACRDGSTFVGRLAPDEEATWDARLRLPGGGRVATDHSVCTLDEHPRWRVANTVLVNPTGTPLRVQLDAGASRTTIELGPGERMAAAVELPAGRRTLQVTSDSADHALGLARVGACVESITLG